MGDAATRRRGDATRRARQFPLLSSVHPLIHPSYSFTLKVVTALRDTVVLGLT